MRRILDGNSLIVFGLMSLALGLIIGGAFPSPPMRGLIWLKASPRLWYYALAIHWLGLWIAGTAGVVIGCRALSRQHPLLV